MKYKKKQERLKARIKQWNDSKGEAPYSGHLRRCPGSQKKT